MTTSLIMACGWGVIANLLGMFPSRHKHWPSAYVLIAAGIPLLVFVVHENGLLVGVVVLAAGMSVLRWPVRFLLRWLRSAAGRLPGPAGRSG